MNKLLLLTLFLFSTLVNAQIVINEVDADNPSTDTKEFIELKTTNPNTPLDGYVVVLFNGSDDSSYDAFDLDGYTSDVNGLFVLGTSGVSPSPDLIFSKADNVIQNGADAVAIYRGDATDFPNDTPITQTDLIDAIVYDTNDGDDPGLLNGLGVSVQYNENENSDKDHHSNQRKADNTFEAKIATPGALNNGTGVQKPTIAISTTKNVYAEGEQFDITFTCSEDVKSDLTINYTLTKDNFTTSDYTGDLSVTIGNGTTTATSTIALTDDTEDEGDETLVVTLDNLNADYQATNNFYAITIKDNDYAVSNYGTPLNPTYGKVSTTASDDYYSSLYGLSGQDLKNAITTLISDASVVRAQTYGDVWDMLKEADVNPSNNSEIWLLYSEQGRGKSEQQGSGSSVGKWNREHVYPQSRGGFKDGTSRSADGKEVYMNTDANHTEHGHADAHSLRPADSGENTRRSNNDFGEEYSGPAGNAGSWKGDVARSVMYMALRYNALDVVTGNPDNGTVGQLGDLTHLLAWHKADRPDDYEMHRNNVIYDWQKNRNPFIDFPDLVDYVFGDKQGSVFNKSTAIDEKSNVLYFVPNPVVNKIRFKKTISGYIEIYDLNGKKVLSDKVNAREYDLSTLKSGLYFYQIQTKTESFKGKIIKK
ncbi:endonuclease [Halosquirtibacter xylanolyticus]|uniref:endonuclease n=1 Tax=Halosquirtibacter xylanolyticus TaxID=3374599 RepID=UPI003747BD0B|nr:endonuclease [Prolixibacteraceae bacterium]